MTGIVPWLADGPPRNTGPDFGKASPVGLLIIVLLLICTCLLVWSMNRHLKKLPERFDRPDPDDGTVSLKDAGNGTVSLKDAGNGTVSLEDAGNDTGNPPHEPGG